MKPATPRRGDAPFVDGIRRSIRLFQSFRNQFDDQNEFYTLLADDTVALLEEQTSVAGERIVDIGGGRGYFAQAFRRAGAASVLVEPGWESMGVAGRRLGYGVIGDGTMLPLVDGAFDISFSSNVLEHVAESGRLPGRDGTGGPARRARVRDLHQLAVTLRRPRHRTLALFGGRVGRRTLRRTHGVPPKNRYGVNLFALHIGDVLALVKARTDVQVVDAYPRYYPRWTRPLVKIRGLREVATWNLAIVMRRHVDAPRSRGPLPTPTGTLSALTRKPLNNRPIRSTRETRVRPGLVRRTAAGNWLPTGTRNR